MIKISSLKFSLLMVAKSNEILITDVNPYKEYTDGKPSENIAGDKYTVVCPVNKYESFSVKVRQAQPTITNEQIEAAGGSIEATFIGFEGKFYRDSRSGEYLFTAKAEEVEVIK